LQPILIKQALAAAGETSLHPTPVFPDEAGIQENQHFSQIQKLFSDAPIKMHYSSPLEGLLVNQQSEKKSPNRS
jgi:hypothetical protein